jgi:predicted secreted protein
MVRFILILIIPFILVIFGCTSPEKDKKEAFKKTEQPEIIQLTPKKPTRILLKRTSKGNYSWELRGEDVDEIIKIDKKLKRYTMVNGNSE